MAEFRRSVREQISALSWRTVLAMVVIGGLAGWLYFSRQPADSAASASADASASPTAAALNSFGPAVVKQSRIAGLPKEVGHPAFWAGPAKDRHYELTLAKDGATGIRYVAQADVQATEQALTVATVPVSDAYQKASELASSQGATSVELAPGTIAVAGPTDTHTGYLAVKGQPFLVQVFDPVAGRAWALLKAGKIVAIKG